MNSPEPTLPASGLFDFRRTRGFARAYLHTYYAGPPQIDERLLSRFLVREAARLPRGRFLEIGCGPTVHHVLPIAPHVAEVHMVDYLDDNLSEVRAWRDGVATAHDWRRFTRLSLQDAGLPYDEVAVRRREALVRARIVRVDRCNLMAATPPGECARYDAVGCFYCAEEVGVTTSAWAEVVGRVAAHVAPGGTLLMAALAGMSSYVVTDPDGVSSELPCAPISDTDVRALLPTLGFPLVKARIESHAIELPDVGVTATLMVAARKELR